MTIRSSRVKQGHVIHVSKLEEVRESLEILSNASNRKELADGKEIYIFLS
jgi:hypothetical protein